MAFPPFGGIELVLQELYAHLWFYSSFGLLLKLNSVYRPLTQHVNWLMGIPH